jgi:hypothetical protein
MWEILDVLRRIGRGENKSVVARARAGQRSPDDLGRRASVLTAPTPSKAYADANSQPLITSHHFHRVDAERSPSWDKRCQT